MDDDGPFDDLLWAMRKAAFDAGDYRSLVAIAAEFERNGIARMSKLIERTIECGHNRNGTANDA